MFTCTCTSTGSNCVSVGRLTVLLKVTHHTSSRGDGGPRLELCLTCPQHYHVSLTTILLPPSTLPYTLQHTTTGPVIAAKITSPELGGRELSWAPPHCYVHASILAPQRRIETVTQASLWHSHSSTFTPLSPSFLIPQRLPSCFISSMCQNSIVWLLSRK